MRRRGPAHRDPATPLSPRSMAAFRALVASRLAATPAFAPRPGLRLLPLGGWAPSPRAALHASAPRPGARVALVSGRGRGAAEAGLPPHPLPGAAPPHVGPSVPRPLPAVVPPPRFPTTEEGGRPARGDPVTPRPPLPPHRRCCPDAASTTGRSCTRPPRKPRAVALALALGRGCPPPLSRSEELLLMRKAEMTGGGDQGGAQGNVENPACRVQGGRRMSFLAPPVMLSSSRPH